MDWLSKIGKSEGPTAKFHHFVSAKYQNEGRGIDPEKEKGLDNYEIVISSTRDHLLEVVKALTKWIEKGSAFYKQSALWGETLAKAKLEGDNAPNVEGFAQAMTEISKLQGHISDLENVILTETQTKVVDNLNNFIETAIKDRKLSKRKYEKSRADYEAIVAKAKALASSKKIDVLKLYATEKEKEKARKIMETHRREHMEYLEDLQARLVTDVLDILIASGETHSVQLGQGYAELSALWEYLEKLKDWCGKEEEYHIAEVAAREEQWARDLEADEASATAPLFDLLCHPSLILLRCLRDAEKGDISLQYSHTIITFVRLLDSSRRVVPCMVSIILHDITSNTHGAIMFHTNPTALEIFHECNRLYGGDYIKTLLDPVIQSLAVSSGSFSGFFLNGSCGRTDLVNNADGVAKVVTLLESILTSLIASSDLIPNFHIAVMSAVRQDCPPGQVYTALNNYLLGRVIAPALQEPHKFGVTKDPVTESSRGCLHFMGQFFHIFSNNETFPAPPNAPMAQLNDLITKWREPLDRFWDSLRAARQAAEVPLITQGTTEAQEIAKLASSLKDYYPVICQLLVGGVANEGARPLISSSPSSNSFINNGGTTGGVLGNSNNSGYGIGGEEGDALMNAFSSALALLEPDVKSAVAAANGHASDNNDEMKWLNDKSI